MLTDLFRKLLWRIRYWREGTVKISDHVEISATLSSPRSDAAFQSMIKSRAEAIIRGRKALGWYKDAD